MEWIRDALKSTIRRDPAFIKICVGVGMFMAMKRCRHDGMLVEHRDQLFNTRIQRAYSLSATAVPIHAVDGTMPVDESVLQASRFGIREPALHPIDLRTRDLAYTSWDIHTDEDGIAVLE